MALHGEKILLGPSSFAEHNHLPFETLSSTGCEIVPNPFKRKLSRGELHSLLSEGITGIIAGLEPIDRDIMEQSHLRVISRCGSGVSNVDLEAARQLGIKVFTTPDAPTIAVAELTIGAVLSLIRHIPQSDRDMHQGKWKKRIGAQLSAKTVMIIGFGRIGRKVAELLKAFTTEIVVYDPYLTGPIDGAEKVDLADSLSRSDIITLHCSEEKEILGKREFEMMKHGVLILNAARGTVINEHCLIDYLNRGIVAGAWLDTFSEEPYNGKLKDFSQVIMTPHIGSYTNECRLQMEMEAVTNLIAGFEDLNR